MWISIDTFRISKRNIYASGVVRMKIAGIIEPEDEHIIHVFSNTQFSRELHTEYIFRKGYKLLIKSEMEEQHDRTHNIY